MIQLENKLYTSTEVASILGVSLRSVYRYIEEGKLTAEVKTATGRHRFTKQDILDFLYPDGEQSHDYSREPIKKSYYENNSNSFVSKNSSTNPFSGMGSGQSMGSGLNMSKVVDEDSYSKPDYFSTSKSSNYSTTNYNDSTNKSYSDQSLHNSQSKLDNDVGKYEDDDDTEGDTDWLSKFRAAAEKFKLEDQNNDLDDEFYEEEELENPVKKPILNYYRSSLGGLKDIAQSLDKSSKEIGAEYAFTLNAGLSLHKPIKPFSLLHAYIKPYDLNRFEKYLSLSPSDGSNAQICLITTENNKIYSNKEILHGLSVVSNSQLKDDVEEYMPELKDELLSIL